MADPGTGLHRFTPALSLAVLGVVALASLVRGEPFTLVIARRSTPPEVWDLPAFVTANVAITRVWAASFLATAAVCALVLTVAPDATGVWVAAEMVGFAVPVAYTDARRKRAAPLLAAAA